MSQPDFNSSSITENAPSTPNGKTTIVAPIVSDGEHVELSEMMPFGPDMSPDKDIMQLARLGDIHGIEKLFQSGTFDPTYCDAEGISPLHWAAINNQYAMCQFLLNSGADVNKKGGESVATPAMWAAQRCHYYTVNLLLQHGADPLITDIQGYNILHLATFEGNIYLLVLLLHQNIEVDVTDLQGHTCLMWAAYKGFPSCVDLFLRWGANVHASDESGFTALHWALVKGSLFCIQKLIEYGADRFVKTSTGKTPAITAEEMKTVSTWHKALKESGYNENGNAKNLKFPFSNMLLNDKRVFMNRFYFLFPFFIIWAMIMILSHMVVFAGIPLALCAGFCLQWSAQQLMDYAPSDMKHMHKTPWLAGVFSGSFFWIGLNWIATILPATFSTHAITNLSFGVLYSFCAYFYTCTMTHDPGYVPKLSGLTQQKAVIDELLSLWKFDENNFCVPCMVRRPLRSKHCKQCRRCVAKHDHHCPWVFNCIGVNNHRQFLLYLLCLEFGIILFVKIVIGYFENKVTSGASGECNLLSSALCQLINVDSYTLILAAWGTLQLTWVTMLMFVQLVQISRALTTWENMRSSHRLHSGKASEAIKSVLSGNSTIDTEARHMRKGNHHTHKKGCFSAWKRMLGVDNFMETALGKKESQQNRNPFSAGCLTNCRDFWCDSAPILGERENGSALLQGHHVDYTNIYEAPHVMNLRGHHGETIAYESLALDDGSEI
ncbi:BgTH12-06437 [Blumeria graminis f. sp. triticale]|uniref:Palmitoyltransferase n=1 Tax=Blumeria graminis f. sp. triticale TaxID=1689686 RepID=A0A9W4D3P3_BLUGR|nr:BgTH12-06437 [Blumeria graminis f. sp. triticale]